MVNQHPLSRADAGPSWLTTTRDALANLDDRAEGIIRERVLVTDGHPRTLKELGDRYELSRERIRQIEAAAVDRLRHDLAGADSIKQVIARVRELGPIFSLRDLESVLGLSGHHRALPLEVRLLLYVAGPYRVVDETITGPEFEEVLADVLAAIGKGPIPLTDLRQRMAAVGLRADQHLSMLAQRRDVRIIDGMVVKWAGSIGDKAATLLALRDEIMTADEIHDLLGEGSLATLKNYLGSEARFLRRGPQRWGLAEWGGESYKSIAEEMVDELRRQPNGMPVDRLQRILQDRFGIGAASVEIMSATHPRFVRDAAWVRLRGDAEPYVPDTALEETPDCVVIGGSWAWRHAVSRDTLRGSGHAIPEAFAANLRLLPEGRSQLPSMFGEIPLYWPSQSPGIGSLRRVAESLCAVEGDLLFVIPRPEGCEFKLVPLADLVDADPARDLLLRLGQTTAPVSRWLSACAIAVGLPEHALAGEVEELLEIRGDRDVLRLFQVARRAREGDNS